MPTHAELTTWQAADWEQMSSIWSDLVGSANLVDESHMSRFGGESITPQQSGYVFQTWIIEAFRLGQAEIERPYRVPVNPGIDNRIQHEVDGLMIYGWNGFLIESKFERVDFSPIARLHLLAELRPIGTMGLFFTAKGFTEPALDSAHFLRPMRVLMFGRDDIEYALSRRDFAEAIRIKWKAAVKYGRANLPIANADPIGIVE